jgi:MoxR-like ATPase
MAKLLFKDAGSGTTQEVVIKGDELTVGRNQTNALPIAEPSVSGNHARVAFIRGEWKVIDNGSSNGTFVNDKQVTEAPVKDGDQIKFGTVEFTFKDDTKKIGSGASAIIPAKKEEAKKDAPAPKPNGNGAAKNGAELEDMGKDDVALIADLNKKYLQIKEQLAQVIIGQTQVVEEVMIAVFSRGHALLVGVPGLAKTLLISTISKVLDLSFKRVQFTPDLMPSDITGTDVLEEDKITGQRQFRFVKGPIFTNMLLADEINRTPPKTQAALLEAMQEHHVTVGAATYHLDEPFFVLATQNPIEQEGTYPLPEAQMDRFMFNIVVDYPNAEEESEIISSVTGVRKVKLGKILDGETVIKIQEMMRRVPVAPHVIEYARNLVRATRPKQPEAPDFVKEMVGWGAGPRAGIALIMAAKARAILYGRHNATTADVTAVAHPVLRHRVITTFNAEAAGVTSDQIIRQLIEHLKPGEYLDV